MTRINLVPPEELTDQHLFSEFREIKMVPKSLRRSITARGVEGVLKRIPGSFTLNTGHVSFFYDKGLYLSNRYELLKKELNRRGVYDYNRDAPLDPDEVMVSPPWNNDWIPTEEAFSIIRNRIQEKIDLQPSWYKYEGRSIV